MKITIPRNIKQLKQHLNDPLFKNTYYLMATTVVGSILGFIFWMLVARYYTPHDVGLATALLSAAGLLTMFSMLGFDIGIIRFLPNEEDKQSLINSCLTLTFILSVLLSIIFILGLDIWSPALSFICINTMLLLFFIVLVLTTALVRLQQSIFVALRTAELSFIQNTTLSILKLIFVLFLVAFGVFGIIASWAIAACIALVISTFLLTPRRVHSYLPIPTIKKGMINDMSHFSFGNYIVEIFASIPSLILPLMIINVLNPEMTAYFFMALAIAGILIMTSTSVNSSLFAEGSYAPEKIRNNVIKSLKFTFIILIPLIVGIFLFGDKILLLFGKEYSENAFGVLCILALSSIPIVINDVYKTIKKVQMQIKPILYLNAIIAILAIGMSYVLMEQFGLIGAGMGYTLGQGIGAGIVIWLVMKREGWT